MLLPCPPWLYGARPAYGFAYARPTCAGFSRVHHNWIATLPGEVFTFAPQPFRCVLFRTLGLSTGTHERVNTRDQQTRFTPTSTIGLVYISINRAHSSCRAKSVHVDEWSWQARKGGPVAWREEHARHAAPRYIPSGLAHSWLRRAAVAYAEQQGCDTARL